MNGGNDRRFCVGFIHLWVDKLLIRVIRSVDSLIGCLDANDRERAFPSFQTRTCCPCRARTASFISDQQVVQLAPVLKTLRGWTSMCGSDEEQ
jgi:hypothetical protein